jgi:hypothetical protein
MGTLSVPHFPLWFFGSCKEHGEKNDVLELWENKKWTSKGELEHCILII